MIKHADEKTGSFSYTNGGTRRLIPVPDGQPHQYIRREQMKRGLKSVLIVCLILALATNTGCVEWETAEISGIRVSNLSQSTATVFWQTDKPADSRVEYGLTTEYEFVASNQSVTTNHQVTLRGLEADTTYHFRVMSSYGESTATSGDHVFTTLEPIPTESSSVIQRSPEPTGYIPCFFTWEYAGSEWNWDINVPEALYDYYKDKPRPSTEDYSVYVTDPYDDDFISSLVEALGEGAQQQHWDEWETINFAVSFVQSLPYTSDMVTTPYDEYPRYPIETVVNDGGDCEDTSILMAAILDSMGYGVVLISPPEHMAVGVLGGEGVYGSYYEHNGQKYFYLETTGEGWEIGEVPDEYEGGTAHIYDIVPIPILSHNWTATTYGWHITLEVRVDNLGTAAANDVYVLAGFDAGGGMLWNPEESSLFDLDAGYYRIITLTLDEPTEKHTRLVVQIVDDGYAVDESYSEWFDT